MAAEARLQTRTIQHAKHFGVHAIRMCFKIGVTAGWPDVLFLIPFGRPLFIEFKAPGKRPTPLQLQRIKLLTEAGYDVCVCSEFDAARAAIASAMERASLSAPRSRAPEGVTRRRAVA